jgi:hypothetical protein
VFTFIICFIYGALLSSLYILTKENLKLKSDLAEAAAPIVINSFTFNITKPVDPRLELRKEKESHL